MRVGRTSRGLGLALALVLTAPSVAVADETLTPSGALVYSWHGDPARGCARFGVCGVQGVLIVRPHVPVFLSAFTHGLPAMLDISSADASARVRRTDAGSSGDCIDAEVWPNIGAGALTVSWTRSGQATAVIPPEAGPSSGRCAGPVSGDLGGVLHGHRSGGAHPSFTFAGRSSFAAGPYSGTFVAHLSLRPATGQSGFSSTSVSGPTGLPGRPKMALFEQVVLRVRVSAPASAVSASLAGEPDPGCAIFDACGTTGQLTLHLRAAAPVITVIAQRRVARPVSRSRALADFRAGRLALELPLPVSNRGGQATETIGRPGSATCTDTRNLAPIQLWFGSPFGPASAHRIPVILSAGLGGPTSFARTYCPGPQGSDVFGSNGTLATGELGAAQLLRSHGALPLRATGRFTGGGYSGARSGGPTLSLSLLHVHAGTVREPVA